MNAPFEHIVEHELSKGGRLIIAPTATKDLVCVEGSLYGGKRMVPHEQDVLPTLAAALLDAGTVGKTKEQIRERLAARGISLDFSASMDRTYFSGRCFPEDLSILLSTIAECLSGAQFPEREVKAAQARELGALAEDKTNTRAQAERALAAQLYVPSHSNYMRPLAAEEKSIRAVRRRDLADFKKILGRGGLVLVVGGDVDVARVRAIANKAFGALGTGTPAVEPFAHNTKKAEHKDIRIAMPDKANVSVLLGVSVPVTYRSENYFAMKVLVEMLGGNTFNSHLMQTLRERDGLTYGVYARLAGLEGGLDGYMKVWANFSPDRYAASADALRREIGVFFDAGLTKDALSRTKERICGAYRVSLSTTDGLTQALHLLATQERPLEYLETFPSEIQGVDLDGLHTAAALIPQDNLSLVAAGTFKKI
jgi:zinc protease